MRLTTLDLLAFGHFTNKSLVFSDTPGAIDIVFGNNEAGKSTSRRGVSGFFFGIPVRTTDDFVHQKPTLRIGASVITAAGEKVQLVRRKGAKDTLRDGSDNVMDEEILARALGGLDHDLFEQMFSLSRDELVSGGNDLLAGKGSLGAALFGASMGLAGINELVKALEDDAQQLFKPGGSNPALNKTLRELDESRRRVRDLELRPSVYLAHEKALSDALAERSRLDGDLRLAKTDLARLERNKQLLPLVVLRTQALAALDALTGTIVLPEAACQQRIDAQREHESAATQLADLQERIDSLKLRLSIVQPNEALIARAEEIRALHTEIGAHRKAARDLPGLRTQQRAEHARATTLLAQTHPGAKLAHANDLRLTVGDKAAITALSDQFGRLDEARQQAELRVTQAEAKLTRVEKRLADLPEPRDTTSAAGALDAARKLGDIEATIAEGESAWRAADAQLQADLLSLPLFDGSIDDVERLPVPVSATVARFVTTFDDIADRARDLAAQEARLADELAGHEQSLAAFESAVTVPSETELETARANRQSGWQLVRLSLENGLADVDVSEFAADRPLADVYEESVAVADDVADRLRRESSQVARHGELEASLARCQKQLDAVVADQDALRTEREVVDAEWAAVWLPTSIAPLPPSEMQEWLRSRQELLEEAGDQRDAQADLHAKRDLVTKHSAALRRELKNLTGLTDEATPLAQLIGLLAATIDEHRSRAELVVAARREVADAANELDDAKLAADQADRELLSWSGKWKQATAKLGLGENVTPEQVRAIVESLTDLFAALDDAAGFETRIESIERDAQGFADAATVLAAEVTPDLGDLSPEETVLALERLLLRRHANSGVSVRLRRRSGRVFR